MQPIKDKFATELVLSPLSVVIDPARLRELISGETSLHPDAVYILRKQLEEADVILLNKTDQLDAAARKDLVSRLASDLAGAAVREVSARTGDGVSAWLDDMLAREDAGTRIAEVDYDRYANGEAVLGWLNATIQLHADQPDWSAYARNLLDDLRLELGRAQAAVGHVKLLVTTGNDCCIANLTHTAGTVEVRGEIASLSDAELTLNARAQMPPADLEALAHASLARVAGTTTTWQVDHLRCFRPGRPAPTYRYDHIV
jgi:G3E family GTPase